MDPDFCFYEKEEKKPPLHLDHPKPAILDPGADHMLWLLVVHSDQ